MAGSYQTMSMRAFVWIFISAVGLLYVGGEEVIRLQELEGNTVTLHTGGISDVQSNAQIQWLYKYRNVDISITNSLFIRGEIITDYYSDRFRDRLQLDRTTGSLTIRNISRKDSGVYKLQTITKGTLSPLFSFTVTVYAPVSKPVIRNQPQIHTGSSKVLCFLLCSVENGKDVNLSWYEEEERISSIASTDSSEDLYLPLNITHLDSTYTCVAANPVSNQTTQINLMELCYNRVLPRVQYIRSVEFVVRMVLSAVVVLALISILLHYFTSRTVSDEETASI